VREVSPGRPHGRNLSSGIKAMRSHRGNGLFQRFVNYLDEDFGSTIDRAPETHEREGVRVVSAGPNAFVYFVDTPEPLTIEAIDERQPGLVDTLSRFPGIGFVLVRSAEHGGLVLGAHGAEIPVDELSDEQPGPLADFGPGAADAVRRTHTFPHVADIMVNSWYDPADGEVLAFEEQIGSHGGLGGAQGRPFLLSPLALSEPVGDGTELVGAEHVHRVLRRWLRESDGPQVPLTAREEDRRAA
jgi:hypothetical protein